HRPRQQHGGSAAGPVDGADLLGEQRWQRAPRCGTSLCRRRRHRRGERERGGRCDQCGELAGHLVQTPAVTAARTGESCTGIPFSTALPDSTSNSCSSASTLLLVPPCSEATDRPVPSTAWPQPWGRLTTPGMISSVTST